MSKMVGIGCDIIEIARVERSCRQSAGFIDRVFTPLEQDYCKSRHGFSSYAGRFAAKEAVGKAIGVPLSWTDIEILNDQSGKPQVFLHGRAKEIVKGRKVLLSISHSRDYAMAVAAIQEK